MLCLNLAVDDDEQSTRVVFVNARASAKNSCVSGRMPPSPWIDSTSTCADFIGELGPQIGNIIEANNSDTWNDRAEGLTVFGFVCCRNRAEGAAVETLLESQELRADGLPFAPQEARVRASKLQRSFPGFGAGVGEEDGDPVRHVLSDAVGQVRLSLVVKKEIRRMNQRAAFVSSDSFFNRRMPVAERVHAEAAEQVEIARSPCSSIRCSTFAANKKR